MARKVHKRFDASAIDEVHQSGAELTRRYKGVNVEIHWREGEATPCCAEIYSDSCIMYAEIGLTFAGTVLTGFHGVLALPYEVALVVREQGYTFNPEMFPDFAQLP